MKRPNLFVALGLAAAAVASPRAQEASPGPEPRVQRTVIDERGARIDELRVRGQLQQVTVSPKGGARPYQVLTGEGAHGVDDGRSSSRGAAGQRVWHVLSF